MVGAPEVSVRVDERGDRNECNPHQEKPTEGIDANSRGQPVTKALADGTTASDNDCSSSSYQTNTNCLERKPDAGQSQNRTKSDADSSHHYTEREQNCLR